MIKLMIVDDEAIIRKGIRYYIDWKSYDIEVVGEAADGQSAINAALTLLPDIVVTDIKMPIMNGIEMAKELKKLVPKIKIIILTGYNENEYLMSAIKFGVTDFVLKTANTDDIVAAVLKSKDEILSTLESQKNNFSNSKIIEQNFLPIRRNLMSSLVQGTKKPDELLSQAKCLDLVLCGPHYLLFYIKISGTQNIQPLLIMLSFHLDAYSPFIDSDDSGNILGLINVDQKEPNLNVFTKIIDKLKEIHVPKVKLLIAKTADSLENIPNTYQHLMTLSQQSCWNENYSIVVEDESRNHYDLSLNIILMLEDEVIQSFSSRNSLIFLEKASQYYTIMCNNRIVLSQFKESVKRMVTSMYNIMGAYEKAYEVIETIEKSNSVEEIFCNFKQIIDLYAIYMPRSQMIKTALEYIEAHYNEQIQLSQIAARCFVTPSYLSKVFKEEMNIGVVKYIHNLRIKHAKTFLSTTDWKVSDIAIKIGYSDYKRFSAYFLKVTGMSPREYRSEKSGGSSHTK